MEKIWKNPEPDSQAETVMSRERSERMFELELVQRDFGSVEEGFANLAGGGRVLPLLLAQMEATAALARAQEDAAIEAQDVFSQADEALVLG